MLATCCFSAAALWPIVIGLIAWLIYRWSIATFDVFEKRGVDFMRPVPMFGNFLGVVLKRQTFHENVMEAYRAARNKRFYGIFQFRTPLLLISDPQLIKRITVKDFDHFANHRDSFFTEDIEPLFGKSLFMLRDQKWRDMRATLSPAFTGRKMRLMCRLIVDCAQEACTILRAEAAAEAAVGRPFVPELKELFSRCMTDVIATTAFGLQVNSLRDKCNAFYTNGKEWVQISPLAFYRSLFMGKFPRLSRWLGISFFKPEMRQFYHRLVVDTMQMREEHGISRPDMIQLLMDAKRGALGAQPGDEADDEAAGFAAVSEASGTGGQRKRVWEEDDFTAQCFLFFLAGFETSSTLMSTAVHALMENAEVQQRLRAEVDEVRAGLRGQPLSYEVVQRMQYMDMVVSEVMRKWSPAVATDRQCSKRFVIEAEDGEGGREIAVEEGESVLIPIDGIHMDEQYWPDPQRFDPERFSVENRDAIQPFTYMPFGAGPRNCIASRFALMQVKTFLFCMLSEFTFEVAATTRLPVKLVQEMFSVRAEGGYNVHLKPRE